MNNLVTIQPVLVAMNNFTTKGIRSNGRGTLFYLNYRVRLSGLQLVQTSFRINYVKAARFILRKALSEIRITYSIKVSGLSSPVRLLVYVYFVKSIILCAKYK